MFLLLSSMVLPSRVNILSGFRTVHQLYKRTVKYSTFKS